MAERRMFAKKITESDVFLDMPASTQALYFHLNMAADDDGFVNNPKKIQRMIGAADDDMKLLIAKSFIIVFESGIIVIKHWKMHNYIQTDRYKPSDYIEEKSLLEIKKNKAYTLTVSDLDTNCIQDVSIGKVRLGKVSLGKVSLGKAIEDISDKPKRFTKPSIDEIKDYCQERKNNVIPEKFLDYYESNGWKVGKNSMKDWRACVRSWECNGYNKPEKKANKVNAEKEHSYDLNEFDDFASSFPPTLKK